ncbi:OmcA/MtrC family decaheme c-type cytochrome [Shewanella atlantica]|uniref:OmcA/MtrC family decaheme c-type cytochrome n=1 Tax=Shewanella atlantica TaxID=271099 RepID=A0A431WHF2_9GAMM|nr:OmcA/MtrC family decaheme c-type cytochrome [Shewanella atlantica]
MKKYNRSLMAMALIGVIGLTACDGDDGKDGAPGEPGTPGTPGTPGLPAGSFTNTVNSAADFVLTLAPADIVVVGTEDFSLKFTVTGKNTKGEAVPFVGLDKVALYVTNQTVNTTDTGAPMLWANNALTNEFGSSMYCTPTGKATARGGAEVDACTLVEDAENPGTYTGSWVHDGNAPVVLADGDPNTLYRVMIRSYNVVDSQGEGISDKLLSTPLDFNPSTGELAVSTKDIVSNAACIKCHTKMEGYGEGDVRIANIGAHHNYQKVENCITCHNPAYAGGQDDPEKGFNANFNAMIHTIHAGHHLADELTGEALDEFGEIAFPAELNECMTCHDGASGWNDNVYAEACQGCHMDVDFTTGENHRGIVPGSDAACSGCHGAGSLSPVIAHSVGGRDKVAEKFVIEIQSAVVEASATLDMSYLTVTSQVTMNGVPVDAATYAAITDYMTNSGRGFLIGRLNPDTGAVAHGYGAAGSFKMPFTGGVMTAGMLVNKTEFDTVDLVGPIYATAEVQLCSEDEMIVKCTLDEDGDVNELAVANSAPVKYFNLSDSGAVEVAARIADPDRTTISEAKCNTCHGNLTHVKGTHGATEFTQCMACHSENLGSRPSYHPSVTFKTDEVDADGEAIWEAVEGLTYANRDLVTVAHRFHSGNWDGTPLVYRDADGELHGYPAVQTNCSECHKDGAELFGADGGLTSGKRSIQISDTGFISPVAEACRTCHAHSGPAALAHFKSNGAYVEGDEGSTADLPVESCSTCHGEGKQYGIDVMHAGGAH